MGQAVAPLSLFMPVFDRERVSMKNFMKASIFVLLFGFVFIKLSYVLRPHDGDFAYIQLYGMLPKNSIDVVYIGGSSVMTYWAPMEAYEQFGFTSFNFSQTTMPAQLEKYCIVESLKKQSPKLIVADMRPFEYAEDILEESGEAYMFYDPIIRGFTDCFRYSKNRFQAIENSVSKQESTLPYHFDIAKYHTTNLEGLLKINNWKYAFNIPDDKTKCFGGFRPVIRYGIVERSDNNLITEELPLSETLDAIYLDLIKYCANLDREVLFIIPPHAELEENHKKHNYMRRVAKENGIVFLDCNDIFEEIGLDVQTDFYDHSHVQIFGSKKYTKWLGNYLINAYDLPNRKGESEYADWDVAYELWVPKAKEIEQAVFALMPEDIQNRVRGTMN